MDGGPSKVNPPNSHPSNPIHKAATAESKKETKPAIKTKETKNPTQTESVPTAGSGSESHDLNKVTVAVGAVAVAGLVLWSGR